MDLEDAFDNVSIVTASGGNEALAALKEHDFTLILCDILMPDMDGFTVLQKAREKNLAVGTPFLFLSALRQPETIKKGLELGATDFLTKPYDYDELVLKVKNLSSIKFLNDQLESANLALQKMNEEKNRVMRIVSHDLRSPLSGIKGAANILASEYDTLDRETIREFSQSIATTAAQLTGLVNDLLNITRIENMERDTLELSTFDIVASARLAVESVQRLATHKKQQLNITGCEQMQVEADVPKILQVINNLLSNAHKFSTDGAEIELKFERKGKMCVVTVQDDGIGIPEKLMPDVFTKYGPATRSGTDGERGVGLGLPIVLRFVQMHNGTVSIESSEGQGTTVRVELPIVAPAQP